MAPKSKGRTKKDPMLTGYMYSYSKEKNPYDFITNEATGRRPEMISPPSGFIFSSLEDGIEYSTIPPLPVWKDGVWLSDFEDCDFGGNHTSIRPKQSEEFDVWVTSGEGTPGNFVWRMYKLPMEMSRSILNRDLTPRHPMLWPTKMKTKSIPPTATQGGYVGASTWGNYGGTGTQSKAAWQTTTKEKDSGLPFGVRIRCTKCGHWFKTDDLVGHVQCCPAVNEFSDWAIACECCRSLDLTATVKPGFPRATTVTEPEPAEPETEEEQETETTKDPLTTPATPLPPEETEVDDGAGAAAS